MKKSGIDYVDASWGPWRGCTPVSEGCRNCYAKREMQGRWGLDFSTVVRAGDTTFYEPMHVKQPTRFFVCPWGDFFHPAADAFRRDALGVMQETPRHTYVIVTKRPERMIERLYDAGELYNLGLNFLPNVWFLVSVEDQMTADMRIPALLKLREHPSGGWPVLGVSYEPALGPVNFKIIPSIPYIYHGSGYKVEGPYKRINSIDWIVMGGESGPNARMMRPEWVWSTRDACKAAGVPFWFKQWGEWIAEDGGWRCVGKKAAGNLIDGETWQQLPEGRAFE